MVHVRLWFLLWDSLASFVLVLNIHYAHIAPPLHQNQNDMRMVSVCRSLCAPIPPFAKLEEIHLVLGRRITLPVPPTSMSQHVSEGCYFLSLCVSDGVGFVILLVHGKCC